MTSGSHDDNAEEQQTEKTCLIDVCLKWLFHFVLLSLLYFNDFNKVFFSRGKRSCSVVLTNHHQMAAHPTKYLRQFGPLATFEKSDSRDCDFLLSRNVEILALQAEKCTSKMDSERGVSRISPCGSWIWSQVSSIGEESHRTYSQTGTFFMSSHAYEKAACLALGEAADVILHNMLVAVRPSADGSVWEWKEAWKPQEERSEAFPDWSSNQGGVRPLFPSASRSLPLCFRRSSIPPPPPVS